MMPAGRPASYKKAFAKQAQKLCELGATDQEIADFFEVDVRTVYRWKHDHDEFCQALKAGKEIVDERVERSLYQRAIGYERSEEHTSELQSLMRISYAVFCLKKKNNEHIQYSSMIN